MLSEEKTGGESEEVKSALPGGFPSGISDDDRSPRRMVFRNKILTNVAVTSAIVVGLTICPGYLLNIFDVEAFGIPFFWFGLSVVAFFAVWPIVFFFRSLALPKSMTFGRDGLLIEHPFGRNVAIPYEWVIGVDNSPATSHDTLFRFETSNGHKFRLVLENYQVDRMIDLLRKHDLPRKPDPAAHRNRWNDDQYPIKYGQIGVLCTILLVSVTAWFVFGDNHPLFRWGATGVSALAATLVAVKLNSACSVSFEDSGAVMVLRYLLPLRPTRRIRLSDIVEYSVQETKSGIPLFARITVHHRIIPISIVDLHRGERLRERLDDLLDACRIK